MDVAAHIERLEVDGVLLADAAERAGWGQPVAACRWDVRQLVTHIGGVHRWAAALVRTAARDSLEEVAATVGTGPGDGELLDWFRAGHADLVATLRAAPADLTCYTFLPAPSSLAFWARRQAHETAIHRADAESAGGDITQFAVAFAQDGIGEMLHGFARRRSNAIDAPGTVALRPDDGGAAWLVTMGGERLEAAEVAAEVEADASVSGSSSDLYLWLWNRPADVTIGGDASVAERWRQMRVRWS